MDNRFPERELSAGPAVSTGPEKLTPAAQKDMDK
jgi:hypothetical protein